MSMGRGGEGKAEDPAVEYIILIYKNKTRVIDVLDDPVRGTPGPN